jgi:hypothetical protein
MKKSQLKQIIKEELQKEIKVTPKDNSYYLKRMLEADPTHSDSLFINSFSSWDSLDEWMTEGDGSDYTPDDNSPETKEMLELAKVYFAWRDKGLIYHTFSSSDDNAIIQQLTKPFKTLAIYGDGYDGVHVLLAVF